MVGLEEARGGGPVIVDGNPGRALGARFALGPYPPPCPPLAALGLAGRFASGEGAGEARGVADWQVSNAGRLRTRLPRCFAKVQLINKAG